MDGKKCAFADVLGALNFNDYAAWALTNDRKKMERSSLQIINVFIIIFSKINFLVLTWMCPQAERRQNAPNFKVSSAISSPSHQSLTRFCVLFE
jgi:hypothetical protein